ncbi:MAG: tetratricopeptide repeat protein [Bacteroidales bacterium]|jgi:tetratricopeptide (TPR) repeat protein
MSKKKSTSKHKQKKDETAVVAEAISKSEEFLNKYKKHILYTILGIVVILGLIFGYMKLIRDPKREEALAQMFPAEQYFRIDSFDVALNGDGNNLGFKDIIKEYKTKAGPLVYFYAGVCELQLGNYTQAIEYLKKYKTADEIIQARAYCNIGDAYTGLNQLDKALNWYMKAAAYKDNEYAAGYYKKAAIIMEETGDYTGALNLYKTIKIKYPHTLEGMDIDKYISRIEVLMP